MFKLELLNFVEHAGIEDYDMMTKVTITVACNCILWCKKSLKIPKGQLEAINQRRTDRQYDCQNKEDKKTNNDLQNITQKFNEKNKQHKPTKTRGELMCSGRVSSSCSTSD